MCTESFHKFTTDARIKFMRIKCIERSCTTTTTIIKTTQKQINAETDAEIERQISIARTCVLMRGMQRCTGQTCDVTLFRCYCYHQLASVISREDVRMRRTLAQLVQLSTG